MTLSPRSPRTQSDAWDRVASAWPRRQDWLWRQHADAVNAALCRRWLPAHGVGRLLKTDLFDEACGEGLWPTLRALARQVDAVDLSPVMAARARARYPDLAATVADLRALPFADGSFDAVVSNSTLDHFEHRADLLAGLRELARVLGPGGQLLLTLDNPSNPIVGLRNALPYNWIARVGLVPYFVGATLSASAAAAALADLGFAVEATTAILHCPRVLAVPWATRAGRGLTPTAATSRLLDRLRALEQLERWPTRFRTGHYVAVLATRAGAPR